MPCILQELVDLETWLQRLIKVVKRGRLVEARLLIETGEVQQGRKAVQADML